MPFPSVSFCSPGLLRNFDFSASFSSFPLLPEPSELLKPFLYVPAASVNLNQEVFIVQCRKSLSLLSPEVSVPETLLDMSRGILEIRAGARVLKSNSQGQWFFALLV